MASKSLWLNPSKKVFVDLHKRFRDYEHFNYSFGQYKDLKVPKKVPVVWKPIMNYLEMIDTVNLDEDRAVKDYIKYVAGIMAEGADVPPVLEHEGRVFDGRHRTWAANKLGLKKIPVVDISPYWTKANWKSVV